MTPKIFKRRVTLDIVVMAADEAEAAEAVDRHTIIDGVSRRLGPLVEVTDVSQLPPGWNGGELAFSKWAREPWHEKSIKHWLNRRKAEAAVPQS